MIRTFFWRLSAVVEYLLILVLLICLISLFVRSDSMSADNGIYILPALDGWFVTHAQAIENLWFNPQDKRDKFYCHENELVGEDKYNPLVVREVFRKSEKFNCHADAINHAYDIADGYTILEYGVSTLRSFDDRVLVLDDTK